MVAVTVSGTSAFERGFAAILESPGLPFFTASRRELSSASLPTPPVVVTNRFTRQPFTPCDKPRQTCRHCSSQRKRTKPRTVLDEAAETGSPPVASLLVATSPSVTNANGTLGPMPPVRGFCFFIRSLAPARLRTAAFLRFRCSRPSSPLTLSLSKGARQFSKTTILAHAEAKARTKNRDTNPPCFCEAQTGRGTASEAGGGGVESCAERFRVLMT